MAIRFLQLFALWTTVICIVQCCPEKCSCQDKYPLQYTDCAYKGLLAVPTGLFSNVTTLGLSANKITFLKAKSFINVTEVTSLWLGHNQIVTIERDTFAPLIQLRNLDVSNNKIINFPWEDLRNLTALQMLKMNNNEMVSLSKDAFSTLSDLKSLRINNNKFTTIAEGTFAALLLMSHLQIYSNPFTCSCNLEWLRDWITTTQISVSEPDSIVCDSPEHLKGTKVKSMPKLDCYPPAVTITYQPNIQNTELYEGLMVILNCETQGSPKPEVSWEVNAGNQRLLFSLSSDGEQNNLPINDKKNNGQFLIFQNGTLIIPRMSKREDGNYTCFAANELGKAEGSVAVALAGTQKHATNSMIDSIVDKIVPSVNKPVEPKSSKNNIINWPKSGEKPNSLPMGPSDKHDATVHDISHGRSFAGKCGVSDGSEYISNHAFNLSLEDLKQYTFDFGVMALDVSETEAKVQFNPFQLPSSKSNLHLSHADNLETVNKEPFSLFKSTAKNSALDMLYVCVNRGNGHSMVQWSKIEDGVNAYRFHGLEPGTNYTLCLTYGGQDCQVQVVFTTRKKIPSLLIIVIVSTFLLALATVPLLGATCCHLLYKYQGKTYKLIMKAQNPDQMEKQMACDFDHRASYAGSEKNFSPSEGEAEGEGEGEDGEGEAEGSVVTESIPGSSSKTNPEEFEVGSEYSDRLPLGAEAVNISEEINGNYKQPSR